MTEQTVTLPGPLDAASRRTRLYPEIPHTSAYEFAMDTFGPGTDAKKVAAALIEDGLVKIPEQARLIVDTITEKMPPALREANIATEPLEDGLGKLRRQRTLAYQAWQVIAPQAGERARSKEGLHVTEIIIELRDNKFTPEQIATVVGQDPNIVKSTLKTLETPLIQLISAGREATGMWRVSREDTSGALEPQIRHRQPELAH